MKKTISKIIGTTAFLALFAECDDINMMIYKTLICGGIIVFLLYINGYYNESIER